MRILFLTQYFDPEPTQKVLLFLKKLRELGHTIEVVAPIPNYPYGKFYKGYRFKLVQFDNMDGIKVIRAPIFPSHDESSIRRALTYLSFTISSTFIGLFSTKKYDLIYAYHPPNIGFVALLLGFIKRVPVVHDVQDLWPETFFSTGMIKKKYILSIINLFSTWVYKTATALIVISPGFKKELIKRNIPQEKINLIYNWCEESKILMPQSIPNNPMKDNKKFNILYAGNMGKAQNLVFILEAAKTISETVPQIQFNIAGDGLELDSLKYYVKKNQINNVCFIPRVSMNSIGALLISADALLVHLKPDPLFDITVPSKIQAYLAIGKPIINTVGGDASKIIKDSRAGITADASKVSSFIKVCEDFYKMDSEQLLQMGDNGKKYYLDHFSLERGAENIEKVFKRALLKRQN